MNSLKTLNIIVLELIELESEKARKLQSLSGVNSPACCMALGAIDAYRNVLTLIEEEIQERDKNND